MSAKLAARPERFIRLLQRDTESLPAEYFRLPVAGSREPLYRERVYCYELYHQLRSIWPPDFPFALSGEVDKSGHPLLREGPLNRLKPDFLVHVPGDMSGNLIVIEVKPVNARVEGIRSDLRSLLGFIADAGYQLPIFLVYGENDDHIEQFKQRCHRVARQGGLDLNAIQLWWHSAPRRAAQPVEW